MGYKSSVNSHTIHNGTTGAPYFTIPGCTTPRYYEHTICPVWYSTNNVPNNVFVFHPKSKMNGLIGVRTLLNP